MLQLHLFFQIENQSRFENVMSSIPKIFLLASTLAVLSGTVQGGEVAKNESKPEKSPPACTLVLTENGFITDYPQVKILFPSDLGDKVPCKKEKPEDFRSGTYPNGYDSSINCTGRTIQVEVTGNVIHKDHHLRIQINCTAPYPMDFGVGQDVPFAGIQAKFGKSGNEAEARSWVSATFPSTIGVENEGLEKFTGEYNFFSTDVPHVKSAFRIDIIQTKPAEQHVHKMCLRVFDNRADCKVSHSTNDLYFANVGGSNPTETALLQSCVANPSKSCGNKYRGTQCVQDRFCKKLSPIHPHGLIQCTSDNEKQTVQYVTNLDVDLQKVEGSKSLLEMFSDDDVIRIEEENGNSRMEIVYPDHVSNNKTEKVESNEECDQLRTVVKPLRNNATIKLYPGNMSSLECHFIPYLLVPPVYWFVEFKNGTSQQILADYGGNSTSETRFFHQDKGGDVTVDIQSSHVKIEATLGMEKIVCKAYYWNASKVAKSVRLVEVVETKKANWFGFWSGSWFG